MHGRSSKQKRSPSYSGRVEHRRKEVSLEEESWRPSIWDMLDAFPAWRAGFLYRLRSLFARREPVYEGDVAIQVFRKGLFGMRVAGWVDREGKTCKKVSTIGSKPIIWSVDEEGRVYIELGSVRNLVGWIEGGDIYDRYLVNYRIDADPGDAWPPRSLLPRGNQAGLVGHVTPDGIVYRKGNFRSKVVGRIEGSQDRNLMGGLALLQLFD